jgi:uroporphyrinogen decarboxylase
VTEPLLVRAARSEPVERTPVWFMRQAGRSLPEYRAIRERHAFFEVAHTPELCAEVTLQPVRRHDVDAAVMFADIMTPVLGMGLGVELVEGVGPVVAHPIRSLADVEALHVPEPHDAFAPVLEAVRLVRAELAPEKAVIGFCGGPFTVAGYLVEGRPSRELSRTKALMLTEPAVWDALLEKLAATFAAYVAAKVEVGADVIQLFDSWVGTLSPELYRSRVAPWSARILAAVDVPTIHFGTGAVHLLPDLAAAGGDVIGLDWRIPLDEGRALVPGRGVQGNLEPATLLAPWEVVERAGRDVLARAGGLPGHIFNLGHGVLPETDPDGLTRLVALVREATSARRRSQPAVRLRPMHEHEFAPFYARAIDDYAADMERNGGFAPDFARAKAETDHDRLYPQGLATPGLSVFVVEANDVPVGHVVTGERELDGRRVAYLYDIQVDPSRRGEGIGRRALELVETAVREQGFDRVELNVFGGNAAARSLYATSGYAERAVAMAKELA